MTQAIINYFLRIGDALSQLINVLVLFGDNANESISGRAWRLHKTSKVWNAVKVTIDFIFDQWEESHCESSHKADVSRAARLLREQG